MEKLKIAIGSDHGGFQLKEKFVKYLNEKGHETKDFGTFDEQSCDYPRIAKDVANVVASSCFDRGILICGTGIGMSIAANKIKGIRASLCTDTYSAKMTRAHNNSNILCLGQRVTGEGVAFDILDTWLNTEFDGGRHQKRIELIEE